MIDIIKQKITELIDDRQAEIEKASLNEHEKIYKQGQVTAYKAVYDFIRDLEEE